MTKWPVRVAHSLNMAAELPEYVDDDAYPIGLRAATLDSLYVHLYLLAAFAVERGGLPPSTTAALVELRRFVNLNVLAYLDVGDNSPEPFVLMSAERARKDARLVIEAMEQLS